MHRRWQATGTADLEEHATLLERLAGVMDERLAALPDRTGPDRQARPDAMGGGDARDQYALRLSFRVPGDSLEMLHGAAVRNLAEQHATAPPGVAVLSAPGRELVRVRVPYLGDYAEYCERIARTARKGN